MGLIDQSLKKALLDGLSAFQTDVPRSRIVPLWGREVPTKPYIRYGFIQPWRPPGRAVSANPPMRIREALEPTNTILATGVIENIVSSPYILIDPTKDFRNVVFPQCEVVVGSAVSRVFRLRAKDRIELYDPIVQYGQTYSIRRQNLRVFYNQAGLKGIVLQIVSVTPEQADDIGDKVLAFFTLPSGAKDAFSPLGWIVGSIGNLVNVDKEYNGQIVERVRDLTVTLKGRQLLSEVRTPVENVDLTVSGELPRSRDPHGPDTIPNDWRLYDPPLVIREV